jgi:hypothetical protein
VFSAEIAYGNALRSFDESYVTFESLEGGEVDLFSSRCISWGSDYSWLSLVVSLGVVDGEN